MTDCFYNGIPMRNVLLTGISQDQRYDDSGADPLYVTTRVQVETVLHVATTAFALGADAGGDLAAGVALIEKALLTPRRRFTLSIQGTTLLDVFPAAVEKGAGAVPVARKLHQADVDNGPKPAVEILQITGDKSVRIRFTIALAIPNCNKANTPADGILSLRWWTQDDIDQNLYTHRVYEGFVRLASRKVSPHAYRSFVLPPVLPHFKPQRMSFRESPDGLTLGFTLAYQELARVAPAPATTWRGNFRASSPRPGGAIWDAELSVTLEGPRDVKLTTLHGLAVKIMDAKIRLTDRLAKGTAFLQTYAIDEDLTRPTVTHNARIRYVDDQAAMFNIIRGDLGFKDIPGVSSSAAHNPPPTASPKGILLAAIQSQCAPAVMPQQQDEPTTPTTPDPQPAQETTIIDEGVTPYENLYDPDQQKGNPLTVYRTSSLLDIDDGRVALPVGKSSSGASTALVSLHQGFATRTVRIEAERLDRWPPLPAREDFKDTAGIVHRVLHYRPTLHQPVLAADGRKTLHLADLEIVYSLSRVPTAADNLAVGGLPYIQQLPAEKRMYPASEFVGPKELLT